MAHQPSSLEKGLSFGYELEFSTPQLNINVKKDPLEHDKRLLLPQATGTDPTTDISARTKNYTTNRDDILKSFQEALGSASVVAAEKTDGQSFATDTNIFSKEVVSVYKSDEQGWKTWSKQPLGPVEYVWYSFELSSRVHLSTSTMKTDIEKICRTIRQKRKVSVRNGVKDNRFGFHVHVSRWEPGAPDPFTVDEMKKLLTLVWICEPNIQKLHAGWRSNCRRYNGLLRRDSNLAHQSGAYTGKPFLEFAKFNSNPFENGNFLIDRHAETLMNEWIGEPLGPLVGETGAKAIKMIWGANRMDELAWLAAGSAHEEPKGPRRTACSLHLLVPNRKREVLYTPKQDTPRTVEFRYMQGSLDPNDIKNWISVVEALVKLAVSPGAEHRRVIKGAPGLVAPGSGSTSPAKDFHRLLGLPAANVKEQRTLDDEANVVIKASISQKPWTSELLFEKPL